MGKIFVGMGEALWDVFPSGKQIGGAPANFAFHAGQLGFESVAVSAVGNDPLGDEIVDVFQGKHLNHLLSRVSQPTGTVQVTLDMKGIPNYEIVEGTAWDNIPIIPELKTLASKTSIFCFGTLAQRSTVSRRAIHYFLDNMPQDSGSMRIYDINLRQRFYHKQTIEISLAKADVLKLNDEEFAVLHEMLDLPADMEKAAYDIMSCYGIGTVIITCGVGGSHIFTPNEKSYMDTPKVKVHYTVGAGDAFTAGFCSGIVAGLPLGGAHRLAVDLSAYVCTRPGAMPELPPELKLRLS